MAETTNSQQQSSAAKTTDQSSQNFVQNQSVPDMDTEIPSHACNCERKCNNKQCGCVKANIKCGQRCKCRVNGCDNQETKTDTKTEIPSHACNCERKCNNKQCGCVKANIKCGQRCKCRVNECDNQETKTDTKTEIPSHACNCERKCNNKQCGCVNANIKCGQRCKCRVNGCNNQEETANSQQQSSAAKTADESSQSLVQNQSVPDTKTEIPSHACSCKTGCSTGICGCVNRGIRCGRQCACTYYRCAN